MRLKVEFTNINLNGGLRPNAPPSTGYGRHLQYRCLGEGCKAGGFATAAFARLEMLSEASKFAC